MRCREVRGLKHWHSWWLYWPRDPAGFSKMGRCPTRQAWPSWLVPMGIIWLSAESWAKIAPFLWLESFRLFSLEILDGWSLPQLSWDDRATQKATQNTRCTELTSPQSEGLSAIVKGQIGLAVTEMVNIWNALSEHHLLSLCCLDDQVQ